MSHAEKYTIYIFHISNKKLRSWMSADLDWFNFKTFQFKNLTCIHIILPASTNICCPCRQNNYICILRFATLVEKPFMVLRADKIKFVPRSLLIHPTHLGQVETNSFLSAKINREFIPRQRGRHSKVKVCTRNVCSIWLTAQCSVGRYLWLAQYRCLFWHWAVQCFSDLWLF